jgi:hypothetical protein
MNIRSLLYRMASLLGDANAVRTGRVPQRIVRKVMMRETMRDLNKLWRF